MQLRFFCLWLLLAPGLGFAQSLPPTLQSTLDAIATRDVPPGAPGIATAVIQQGEVVYQKVAGYADLEDSTLISDRSRFNIASNAKQFTALGILLLVESGQLSLDEDVRRIIPELYPKRTAGISLAQLLTHRSGLRDVYDLWALQGITWWNHSFTNADALALLARQEDLNFEPGTNYGYSNSNYIVLAEVIARVSGQTFTDYMDGVFAGLGMNDTHFEPEPTAISPPVAQPYFNFDSWVTYGWHWGVVGDGNLFSTLADQIRWEQILQGGVSCDIPESVLRTSQARLPGLESAGYGYGLEFDVWRGLPYRFHEGATGAWKATTVRFSQADLAILTFTNSGKTTPDQQTRTMAEVLVDSLSQSDDFPIVPPASDAFYAAEDVVGIYLTPENYRFELVQTAEGLILKREGRSDVRLERESGNVFHEVNDPPFKQAFGRDNAGKLTVTAYYPGVAPFTLTQCPPVPSTFDFAALNGTYTNGETDSQFTVQYQTDRTYAFQFGEDTYSGRLVTPNKVLVRGYTLDISRMFGKDSEEIVLSANRLQRVVFVREE